MTVILAFAVGCVVGWFVCNKKTIDGLPAILRENEQEKYDKTIKQIETDVGSDFKSYFGVRGAMYGKPKLLGRENSNPAVVVMLKDFIDMTSQAYFSEIDDEILKDYLEENDLPNDDVEAAIEHYGKNAREKYDSARREAFDNLINEISSK
jgi:hypothetical protein